MVKGRGVDSLRGRVVTATRRQDEVYIGVEGADVLHLTYGRHYLEFALAIRFERQRAI